MGRGPAPPVKFLDRMGHDPAHPIKFREDGARPDPAHQFFRGWAAVRPGPSIFRRMGCDPTQPITFSIFHGPARPTIFLKVSARPGPAHHIFEMLGPARPASTAHDKLWMTISILFANACSVGDYSDTRILLGGRTERNEVWGTGIEVVWNLTKCRLRLNRTYQSVGYRYGVRTEWNRPECSAEYY